MRRYPEFALSHIITHRAASPETKEIIDDAVPSVSGLTEAAIE